jgi:hypothetical protein
MCVWTVLNEKLGEEVVAHRRIEKELGETKATLLKESDEHDTLRITVGSVSNNFIGGDKVARGPSCQCHRPSMWDSKAGAAPQHVAVVRDIAFPLRERRNAGDEPRLCARLQRCRAGPDRGGGGPACADLGCKHALGSRS